MTHQEVDERSLALHRLVAAKIRLEPERFAQAAETLRRWRKIVGANSQPYLLEWERLFALGVEESLSVAVEDSERAAALRQSSPLAVLLTSKERFTFLREWRSAREAKGS